MRASPAALRLCLAATVVIAASCAAGAAAGPLILLTNTWKEIGAETNRFSLVVDGAFEPLERGTFTGTKFTSLDDTGTPIDGDWGGGRIRMTIYTNPAETWRAVFHAENPDTLTFTRTVSGAVQTLRIFRESVVN